MLAEDTISVPPDNVLRDWSTAKAWLYRELAQVE
jgi:hypothetical protein